MKTQTLDDLFRRAVEAIDAGDLPTLNSLLADHPELAHEYEELKLHLAAQWVGVSREQRETYSESKSDFIERVVALALKSGYALAGC